MAIVVKLEDKMGNDLRVANAARQTFGAGFKEWSEIPRTNRGRSDRQLIEDLASDEHWLPFRHPHVTLSCCAPVAVARQLAKHQVGFSWSEISRRYKTKGITCHLISQWRAAPATARQGSGDALPSAVQKYLGDLQRINDQACLESYRLALEAGAAPEQARFLLPQSMDILWTWTGSLLGMAYLFNRRTHPDTQGETREFAQLVAEQVEPHFPVCWKALTS